MTGIRHRGRRTASVVGAGTLAALLAGCQGARQVERASIANRAIGSLTVAVAPAINLSGSTAFDRNRFADLMASELSYAEGVTVIPVSRVLGVLAERGWDGVTSPKQALELVKELGADAILVFSVNEYDPYDPPSIGISAQLYGTWPGASDGSLDPVALSRQANLATLRAPSSQQQLLAQSQRVFDASHGAVVADIRAFAALRDGDNSPYGWRKYVVSQQRYIRYCCHATIRTLLNEVQGSEPAVPERGR